MRKGQFLWTVVVALAALPTVGCAHEAASSPPPVGQATLTSGGTPSTALDDPEIADILRASFIAAVDESNVAEAQGVDPKVAHYARLMNAEYQSALDEELGVIEDRHIVPAITNESSQISLDSKTAEHDIFPRQGPDLERAFLAREVAFQKNLLSVIDNELLPSVQSQDQRNELLRVRPVVESTLSEASQLQAWLLAQP